MNINRKIDKRRWYMFPSLQERGWGRVFFLFTLSPLLAFADYPYTYRYWFDQQTQVVTGGSSSAQVHIDADVASLSEGLHSLRVQVSQGDTLFSPIFTRNFIKVADATTLGNLKCYYMVDGNAYAVGEAAQISNQVYHFDLDMSALSDGLHQLTYWMGNTQGKMTNMRNAFFVKIAAGGNGITQMQYWLNDRYAERQTINYDPRQATVHLTAQLPVDQVDLRPCDYKFVYENGDPYIYAANDLHVMFIDANSRMTNSVHRFIDRRVRILVEPVGEAVESQTFPRITDNNIRWYTVTMNAGDTISLRSNVSCTLQVFSPSGGEIYKSEGTASTTFSGFSATETGVYYLAVHSMTGNGNATLYVDKISNLVGDVDCDGQLKPEDVTALVRYMLGLQICKNPKNADLNKDNKVTLADLTALVNLIKP